MIFQKTLTRIFGSRNDRLVKRYRKVVQLINELEPKIQQMSDAQLRDRTMQIKDQLIRKNVRMPDVMHECLAIMRESMDRHIGIRNIFNPEHTFDPNSFKNDKAFDAYAAIEDRIIQGSETWQTVQIPVEVYNGIRELYPDSRPPFRARCFDVQLVGGLALYEGKTFVAPLACLLRALEGHRCHVVTVNDYLVRRDALWVRPAFEALGLSVGFIQADMDPGGESRRKQYECDITYGTNSEFGFDYLRDNMKERAELQVQGPLDFAIVDEVDSILIDEARTPLIISGDAFDDPKKYMAADAVARKII
jgi:preprotein translocase subunit SecA